MFTLAGLLLSAPLAAAPQLWGETATLPAPGPVAIEGDTAVGLQVKNLLDSLDFGIHELPESARGWIEGALATYRKLFGGGSS